MRQKEKKKNPRLNGTLPMPDGMNKLAFPGTPVPSDVFAFGSVSPHTEEICAKL